MGVEVKLGRRRRLYVKKSLSRVCVTRISHLSSTLFTSLGELLIGTQFTHVIARVPQSFCPNNISTSTLHRVPFLNGEAVELLAVRREAS